LLAQEVSAIGRIDEVGELAEADLLGHAADHVLLFGHFDVEPLLLHLHGVVPHDLLLRMEQGLQNFGLRVRQSLPLLRVLMRLLVIRLLALLAPLCQFELLVHILSQSGPLSQQPFKFGPDAIDSL